VKEVCAWTWIEGVRETWSGGGNIFSRRAEEGWGMRPGEQHQKLFSAGPLYIGDPFLQSDALQDHRITDVSASAGEAEANPTQKSHLPKKEKNEGGARNVRIFRSSGGSPPAVNQ